MKLAAQSDFFIKNYGPEAGLKRLKDIGYECITYTITERYDEPFTTEWTDKELKERFTKVGDAVAASGLKLLYATLATDVYNDLMPHTTEARKKMCLQALKAVAFMGCSALAIRPATFHGLGKHIYQTSKEVTIELFDSLKAEADKLGVKLAVINNTRRKAACYGAKIKDLKELCEKYDAGLVVDPVACYFAGEEVSDLLDALKDRLLGFSINDAEDTMKNPFMPMMGVLDYAGISDILKTVSDDAVAVMNCTPVFKRYQQFTDREAVVSALDTLLYDMGNAIVGKAKA